MLRKNFTAISLRLAYVFVKLIMDEGSVLGKDLMGTLGAKAAQSWGDPARDPATQATLTL